MMVVQLAKQMMREQDDLVQKWVNKRDTLSEEERVEFDEVISVLSNIPLTDEDVETYIQEEEWTILEENKELLRLIDKWSEAIEGDTTNGVR